MQSDLDLLTHRKVSIFGMGLKLWVGEYVHKLLEDRITHPRTPPLLSPPGAN